MHNPPPTTGGLPTGQHDPPPVADVQTVGGRFELVRQLGAGAMGRVWLAIDPRRRNRDNRGEVVIKFLHDELRTSPAAVQLFKDTYCTAQELHHRNLCPLYDLGEDERLGPFQVMRFLTGESLHEWRVAKAGDGTGAPIKEVLRWLRPVADALDHFKDKLVHRDVKPANILISPAESNVRGADEVYLLDFGIAVEKTVATDADLAARLPIYGTAPYMAPEQWNRQVQNERTDQYALAVTAWELLTGSPVFCGSRDEIANAAIRKPVPQLPAGLSCLQRAFNRALAKDLAHRFASCGGFIESLRMCANPTRSTGGRRPSVGGSGPTRRVTPGRRRQSGTLVLDHHTLRVNRGPAAGITDGVVAAYLRSLGERVGQIRTAILSGTAVTGGVVSILAARQSNETPTRDTAPSEAPRGIAAAGLSQLYLNGCLQVANFPNSMWRRFPDLEVLDLQDCIGVSASELNAVLASTSSVKVLLNHLNATGGDSLQDVRQDLVEPASWQAAIAQRQADGDQPANRSAEPMRLNHIVLLSSEKN
ncbi:MAG: serine/threonine-protein kinase [Planctomycetota bacterium]